MNTSNTVDIFNWHLMCITVETKHIGRVRISLTVKVAPIPVPSVRAPPIHTLCSYYLPLLCIALPWDQFFRYHYAQTWDLEAPWYQGSRRVGPNSAVAGSQDTFSATLLNGWVELGSTLWSPQCNILGWYGLVYFGSGPTIQVDLVYFGSQYRSTPRPSTILPDHSL